MLFTCRTGFEPTDDSADLQEAILAFDANGHAKRVRASKVRQILFDRPDQPGRHDWTVTHDDESAGGWPTHEGDEWAEGEYGWNFSTVSVEVP